MENETKVNNYLQLFRERLKSLRGEKSLQEAAQALGISRATLGYYENGDRKPDIEILTKIANYYNVSSDYLLGLTNIKSLKIEDRIISEKTGLNEDSLRALYNLKKAISPEIYLEKVTLELLLSDSNSLLSLLTLYFFINFESACEVDKDDKTLTCQKFPLTQLGLFDSLLNVMHINRREDFYLNAYLLEIQEDLRLMRRIAQEFIKSNEQCISFFNELGKNNLDQKKH